MWFLQVVVDILDMVWNAFVGLLTTVALTALITDVVKVGIGRPRPHFYARCFGSTTANAVSCMLSSSYRTLEPSLLCGKDDSDIGSIRRMFISHRSWIYYSIATVESQIWESVVQLWPWWQTYDVIGNVVCVTSKDLMKEAYKSFPSGHTSCKLGTKFAVCKRTDVIVLLWRNCGCPSER